jgi:hypothetical protein
VVEGAALEKQCAGNGTQGSNPCLSARMLPCFAGVVFIWAPGVNTGTL